MNTEREPETSDIGLAAKAATTQLDKEVDKLERQKHQLELALAKLSRQIEKAERAYVKSLDKESRLEEQERKLLAKAPKDLLVKLSTVTSDGGRLVKNEGWQYGGYLILKDGKRFNVLGLGFFKTLKAAQAEIDRQNQAPIMTIKKLSIPVADLLDSNFRGMQRPFADDEDIGSENRILTRVDYYVEPETVKLTFKGKKVYEFKGLSLESVPKKIRAMLAAKKPLQVMSRLWYFGEYFIESNSGSNGDYYYVTSEYGSDRFATFEGAVNEIKARQR